MKTEQILERPFIKGTMVRQKHKSGYFNATDFLKAVNVKRAKKGKTPKKMEDYKKNATTDEFLQELSLEDGVDITDLMVSTRGRNGGTWVHPYVMLDIALWSDAKLKVKVYKWIYDNLTLFRNNSGDNFKTMNDVLTKKYPKVMKGYMYSKVANKIADVCEMPTNVKGMNRWNNATETELKKREQVQEAIIVMSDVSDDLSSCINHAIKRYSND